MFTPHHLAHAASAFYPSPYDEAAILTVDGVGEWTTASFGVGKGKEVRILEEMHFPDSLGLLYSAFTYFCGFKVNSGEYKLMGLAPYGKPRYLDLIKERLATIRADGSIGLDLEYFGFLDRLEMTSPRFEKLFGGPRNIREYARKETTNFIEVYVRCSVEACAKRDPKGLYKKASSGQIKDLTGPQDLYEEPLQPDLVVDTERLNLHESVDTILGKLEELGVTRT